MVDFTMKYRKYLKLKCECCGFIPIHTIQLDIHHKDWNHENNNPDNLETLCANCHRLMHLNPSELYWREDELSNMIYAALVAERRIRELGEAFDPKI